MMQDEYYCLGLMSGTSCDGLDIAYCRFTKNIARWSFDLLQTETILFPAALELRLKNAPTLSALDLHLLDVDFGLWCGKSVNAFASGLEHPPMFVASHGHTVFHQPEKKLSVQIGSGAALASAAGIPVVFNFRPLDVFHGGQGAPLVPIGDELLFSEYSHCLNLGGFANISTNQGGKRSAWDICPANLVLNYVAAQLGLSFDENGSIGRTGKILPALLDALNRLGFYQRNAPKSLGKEWLDEEFFPILHQFANEKPADLLRTLYEHIAVQLSQSIGNNRDYQVLVTGGGARNTFLMDCLKNSNPADFCLPDLQIIDFKEALVFAFMGLLRWLQMPNVYSSATGAKRDVCSGSICFPY